jgi:putative DNA primase/helicase
MTADEIKSALSARAKDVCAHLFPAGRVRGDEFEVGDLRGTPGRSLKVNVNGKAGVWRDFAADEGGDNLLELWCRARGIEITAAMKEAAEWLGSPPRRQTAEIPPGHPGWWRTPPTDTWTYRTTAGAPWIVVYRYDKPGGSKAYFSFDVQAQRWLKNGEHQLPTLPLYHLDALAAAGSAQVILVEGEKCADALARLGFMTTTTIRGAKAVGKADFSPLLGRRIYIWPDADQPGREYAEAAATMLHKVGAVEVLMVRPPEGVAKGWDVADAIAEGWTLEEIRAQLDAAESVEAPGNGSGTEDGTAGQPNGHAAIDATNGREKLTDLGNAYRFARRHGDGLRYSPPRSMWLVYTGQRWEWDELGEARRLAKETARSIWTEVLEAADSSEKSAIAKWAKQSESAARIEAMIRLAQTPFPDGLSLGVRLAELDGDPWLLNVRNGAVDLRTGKLLNHERQRLLTKMAPVVYDPTADCARWREFLDLIFAGNTELVSFLRRALGYSLTGDVSEQCLFFAHGSGANGKSTLLETIRRLLGDYARTADPELLLIRRSEAHPTYLADLAGARFVTSIEVEEGRHLAEALLKWLTGGDKLKGRFVFRDFFEFPPTHKIWLAANHKPIVRGTDHAVWRRIHLIPFAVCMSDVTTPDPHFVAKLRTELPGILCWAVQGCVEWQSEGLRPPAEVVGATEAYRAEMDWLAAFLKDQCVTDAKASVTARDLYKAYAEWAEANGERPVSQKVLGARLGERPRQPFSRGRTSNGATIWHGLRLRV